MKRIVNEQLHISDSNPIKARAYDYKSFTGISMANMKYFMWKKVTDNALSAIA